MLQGCDMAATPVLRAEPDLGAIAADLRGFSEFAAILRRHLGEVCAETEQASLDILRRLGTIERAVADMVGVLETTLTSGHLARAVAETQASMAESHKVAQALTAQRDADGAEVKARLGEVRALAGGLGDLVEDVQDIAGQTRILAINAAIEAERAGLKGLGLGAVADEVKELSSQSTKVAKRIGSGITALAHRMDEVFKIVGQERLARERTSFETMTAAFEGLAARLATVITEQRDMLARIKQDSEAIVRPIMDLAASVQFQDITRQQLEHAGQATGNVAAHLEAVATAIEAGGGLPSGTLKDCLDEIYASYVMARQRNAHQGDEHESKGALIELF
jgi:methyl-accepting chemotaxis protein